MAKGDHTDLYMIFKDDMGRLIQGESTAELGSSDQSRKNLLKDFNSGKHTNSRSRASRFRRTPTINLQRNNKRHQKRECQGIQTCRGSKTVRNQRGGH